MILLSKEKSVCFFLLTLGDTCSCVFTWGQVCSFVYTQRQLCSCVYTQRLVCFCIFPWNHKQDNAELSEQKQCTEMGVRLWMLAWKPKVYPKTSFLPDSTTIGTKTSPTLFVRLRLLPAAPKKKRDRVSVITHVISYLKSIIKHDIKLYFLVKRYTAMHQLKANQVMASRIYS